MPTYDYQCKQCGIFEVVQQVTEPKLTICPKCEGTEIERLIAAASFILQGEGWANSGYASPGNARKK